MLKKALIWLLGILAVVFIAIQFFQPEKNQQAPDNNHLFKSADVPENIQAMLKNACLDCHSNQTTYPWYDRVAPVSFYVAGHIDEGKDEMNLSEWGTLSPIDKINLLNKMSEEVKEGKMPLKSYTLMHKSARLSKEQVDELCQWAESYGMEIYKGM